MMSAVSKFAGVSPVAPHTSQAAAIGAAEFRDALVGALALMAHADGEMAGAERRRILALACGNARLADIPRGTIVDELAEHEANFRLDPEVAQILAREKLVRVAGQHRLGQAIVNACRAVLPADGVAHPSEYRVLREVEDLLGLDRPPVSGPLPSPRLS